MEALFQMDKTAVCIVKIDQQGTDFKYWQSQPVWKPLAALEMLRRQHYGWTDEREPRLQRVFTIVKRENLAKIL